MEKNVFVPLTKKNIKKSGRSKKILITILSISIVVFFVYCADKYIQYSKNNSQPNLDGIIKVLNEFVNQKNFSIEVNNEHNFVEELIHGVITVYEKTKKAFSNIKSKNFTEINVQN